ncbi:MAG TPA: type I DNA topoisomerase [Candidatus Sumerlaeota bacterium]|nr:type I DNA topoisomerase [Candidatus Sumerlaeota bacterium]
MMTKLVIVESPAKAKTISQFLGKKYRVEASFGHVRDLPENAEQIPEEIKGEPWARFGVNIEKDFDPVYVVPASKRKQIALLKSAMKDADELLLATDEDREGESISWHLVQVMKPKVPYRRIVFHEITREAIDEALRNPRDIDEDLVRAQEGRRILDRLFGYTLSPVLWKKVQSGLSAGRVQSVAVRLIVEREEERRAFKSSQYWGLEAEFAAPTGKFKAELTTLGGKRLASGKDFDAKTGLLANDKVFYLDSEGKANDLVARLTGALPWTVSNSEEKPATQRPYAPFTTSTLQQEANRKLGFGAKRTMQAAQKLYEGVDIGEGDRVGLITYMRTDSVTLSDKALKDAQSVIADIYGRDYARGARPYKTKQRNAQEAHEAIRPTELSRRPADVKQYLDREEFALYELIWKRTIASQMPDAELLRTSLEITADNGKGGQGIFSASGKKILFPGFLRAYVEGSDDPTAELGDQEMILPDLKVGEKIHSAKGAGAAKGTVLETLAAKKHETLPPARYTEASLVKKLEEESIGRPSTYASIISTIQDRGYVSVNKSKQLVPTFVAMAVTDLLRNHFGEYVDIRFTAKLEDELDEIAQGKMTWLDHIKAFYRGTKSDPGLERIVNKKADEIPFPNITLGNDPDSGEPIEVRVGRNGAYLMRGSNGASVTAPIPESLAPADLTVAEAARLLQAKAEGPRKVGVDPKSGEAIYAMTGRFGAYVQVGETPEDKKAPKPRRASLEAGQQIETVTLEEALKLLSLPRELGIHPETKNPIIANKGRFGPYVQHDKDYRSLKKEDNVYTVTFERAMELLSAPKEMRGARGASSRNVLKDFGKSPDGASIQALEGRYGSYVTDGKNNATIPKGESVEEMTLARAQELINERVASGGGKSKGRKKPSAMTAKTVPAKKKAPAKKK